MVAVRGIYENGCIKLDKELFFNDPVEVIVTFLEEEVKEIQKLIEKEIQKFIGKEIQKFIKKEISLL